MPIYIPKIKVRYQPINEILTIKEYLCLTGWELFLAITWRLDFFQACSFCGMLMNHKNFRFTPHKTNDLISCFWTIFVYCQMCIFSKKSCGHIQLYMGSMLKSCQVSEKTNEPSYRQTKGRTDGQTLFHKTLPATAGGPKRLQNTCCSLVL